MSIIARVWSLFIDYIFQKLFFKISKLKWILFMILQLKKFSLKIR